MIDYRISRRNICYSFLIYDKFMAKLVKYMNLSTLYIEWSLLGVGLHIFHDFSPSSLVHIQIRLINQSEPVNCFILPPGKLIKAKESKMINKQIWFPGPLSLDNMVGETRSGLSSVFNIRCSSVEKYAMFIHLIITEQVAFPNMTLCQHFVGTICSHMKNKCRITICN